MLRDKTSMSEEVLSPNLQRADTSHQQVTIDSLRLRSVAQAQGQLLRLLAKAIAARVAGRGDGSGRGG